MERKTLSDEYECKQAYFIVDIDTILMSRLFNSSFEEYLNLDDKSEREGAIRLADMLHMEIKKSIKKLKQDKK